MSLDSRLVVTHDARRSAHMNTCTDTHRRSKNTSTPARPLTLSFCGAVSPTRDRTEKDLVNTVLVKNGANRREIRGEGKQRKEREKTFKWYRYHQGKLLSKLRLAKIYMVYISKKRYKYLFPHCGWVSNHYFQNKWQTRGFVSFDDGGALHCCKTQLINELKKNSLCSYCYWLSKCVCVFLCFIIV